MGKTFIQTQVIMAKERDPFVDSEEEMVTGIQYQQVQDSFSALITFRMKR
jgi:hypothetical protein